MTDQQKFALPSILPQDVLLGLATADRSLLATALALFEDSTLGARLKHWYGRGKEKAADLHARWKGSELEEVAQEVTASRDRWINGPASDSLLRLLVWVELREAFDLPARVCVSERATRQSADDLAAAVVRFVDPPGLARLARGKLANWGVTSKDQNPTSISDVVNPVLADLLDHAADQIKEMSEAEREEYREQVEAELRKKLGGLSDEDRRALAEGIGADGINDAALAKVLAGSGSLVAFSASVKFAGFSAYILAAEASAFIPLLGGKSVVSLVAVLVHPVTVVAASAGIAWLTIKGAGTRVKREVAVRVLALLALQGVTSLRVDYSPLIKAFEAVGELEASKRIKQGVVERYQADFDLVKECRTSPREGLDHRVRELMVSPAVPGGEKDSAFRRLLFPGEDEVRDSMAVAALSTGDVLYSAAAIDPTVISAADFARAEDLSGTISFADFARRIHEMAPTSLTGAVGNLKGYVAEQVVAAQLAAQGHQVAFPGAANEAGWDLLVDGEKFQVKCVSDIGALKAHFATYDYPVIANVELADHIPDDLVDHVYFVDGYSEDLVSQVTESSLADGAGMFDAKVPVYAVAVTLCRCLLDLRKGKVTRVQAAEQFFVDGSTRLGLSVVGGVAGKGLGLLVFGPAGGVVFSVVAPVLAQAQTHRVTGLLKRMGGGTEYNKWKDRSVAATQKLADRLDGALAEKLVSIEDRRRQLGKGVLGDYIRCRLDDDVVHIREQRARLWDVVADPEISQEVRCNRVLIWLSTCTVYPSLYQAELMELSEVIKCRPGPVEQGTNIVAEGAAKAAERVKSSNTVRRIKGMLKRPDEGAAP